MDAAQPTPEVSVVVPAYNAESTLEATLGSILAQTFTDYEVLVVDDGSADSTGRIAANVGPPVTCLRKSNGGVSTARNHGLANARGRYVAFLDADDLWEADKLETQVELLNARPDVGACFTGYLRVDDALHVIGSNDARDYPDFCAALLLRSMVVQLTSTALVRRDVIETVGSFDPAFSQCADWDYALRLSTCTQFAQIRAPLARYRQSAASMSRDVGLLESDTFAVLDKFFATEPGKRYEPLRRQCYGNHWIILSGSYLHAGQPLAAVRCLMNGLRLYPRNARRPLGLPIRWSRRAATRVLSP
jgi:glycosyltransferase involved in cell wall biosynthesis